MHIQGFGPQNLHSQEQSLETHPPTPEVVTPEKSLLLAPRVQTRKTRMLPQTNRILLLLCPLEALMALLVATSPGAHFCLQVTRRGVAWRNLSARSPEWVSRGLSLRSSRHDRRRQHNAHSALRGSGRESIQGKSITEALDCSCWCPQSCAWGMFRSQ